MRQYKVFRILSRFTLLSAISLAAGVAHAAPTPTPTSYTWTGASMNNPTDWFEARNWSPRGVPGALDSASIASNQTVTLSSSATVTDLSMAAGSALEGIGDITVTGSFAATDIRLTGPGMVNIPTGGVLKFVTGGLGANTVGRVINNFGTVYWSGGSLVLAAHFNNNVGASFYVQTNGGLKSDTASNPVFNNAGTIIKSGGNGTTVVQVILDNSGTIDVQTGKLNLGPKFLQSAGRLHLGGGQFEAKDSYGRKSPLDLKSGKLTGSGSVDADVINSGLIAPGNSPGLITINGNYTQTASGILDMEIGGLLAGTQHDQMIVNGSASLAGTLNIVKYNNFLPNAGDNFQLMTYYGLMGQFTNETGLYPGSGRYYYNTYTPTYLVASVDVEPDMPTVSVTSPAAGAPILKSAPLVSGTASDASSGVRSVTVLLYRYATGTYAAGYYGTDGLWSATYNPAVHELPATGTTSWSRALPALADGQYYVRATAKDFAGNTTGSANYGFSIDATAPASVTFTTPASGAFVNHLNTVAGTSADSSGGSGIARVDLCVKKGSNSTYWTGAGWTTTPTNVATAPNWARNHSTTSPMPTGANLPSDSYTLTATAYDKVGNSKATSITVTVDAIAPTVAVTAPANNTNYTTMSKATGTAGDMGGSGLSTVTALLYRYATSTTPAGYWSGGTTWTAPNVAPTAVNERLATGTSSWSLTLPTLTNGQYAIRATAKDQTGNTTVGSYNVFWKTAGTSGTMISSAFATASTSSVKLSFTGALDSVVAADRTRYSVTVNGVAVAVQSATYSSTGYSVTLALPTGSVPVGAGVVASWTNLFDTTGKTLTGKTTTLIAQ